GLGDVYKRQVLKDPLPLIGAAISNALVVLAGSPQYVVYLFYIELAAALVAAVGAPRFLSCLGLFGVVWGLSALVSSPQWFPTLFYLPFTGRASGSWMAPPRPADQWNFLVEFFLPWPLGDDLTFDHMHLKNVWETATYPGILGVILALGGALAGGWRGDVKERDLRLAWAVILLGLYVCGGGWLPGFSSFREPMKGRAVVALGVALAAGIGYRRLEVALSASRRLNLRLWASPAVAMVFGVLFVVLAAWLPQAGRTVSDWLLQGGPPIDALRTNTWLMVLRNPGVLMERVANACWQVAGWSWLGALLLAAGIWRPKTFLPILAVTVFLEPFSAHFRVFVARHPFTNIDLPPGFREAMQRELEQSRRSGALPWRVTLPPSLANRGHLVDGLWETGGYDPLMPRDANTRVALETRRLDLPLEHKRTTIALAVGRRFDFSGWRPELGEPLGDVRRFEVAPAASLFSLERCLRAGYGGVQQFGPDLDTGVHFVDTAPPTQASSEAARVVAQFVRRIEKASNKAHVEDKLEWVAVDSPNEYAYRVSVAQPALALLRTTWLPGWQVWIDGKYWGRPWCANRWMLAAPVESGVHEIRWRYRPVGLWPCLGVSLITLVVMLGWLVSGQFSRRCEGPGHLFARKVKSPLDARSPQPVEEAERLMLGNKP
ncbi:MAG: YfhO family protein, partial [Candidatus Sumerlaeaceae bacterium]|nr:YfhO family protein [Candidatus Sumerlaeaceae bacterium]